MVQDNTHLELSILNKDPSRLQGPELLHALVQISPDHPAVDFLEDGADRHTYSYATLHSLSDQLARTILSQSQSGKDVSPVIPVFLPQSPELYIVLLAILKAGKAFCPLNLDTPAERLKFILQDLSANFLITTTIYVEQLQAAADVPYVLVDDLLLSNSSHQPTTHLPLVVSKDLAYVLYTSGSTGMPKAVSVSHGAITQSLLAHDRHIPEFNRFLQFAAPTFDVSIFEIFFPWFRGRTLVGCTRTLMLDDLPKIINDLDIDAAELTPTVVSNLLHGRSSVPNLKLLLTIGEMLTQHVVDEYGGDESQESMLWAMYGPTEAAVHCTLQPRLSRSSPTGNIGFPLDTVSALIVTPDPEGNAPTSINILPEGEIGELVVAGPQIAEEYLNRPELTARSFINHVDYGHLYRTGDLARICPDKNLEFMGRVVAGQVKLRGQRVELGEIEKIILKVRGCRTAIVTIIADTLIVFCATGSSKVSRADVVHTCRQWLPKHMVPADVCFLSTLPQLPSGKVDKKALESNYQQKSLQKAPMLPAGDDALAHDVCRVLEQQTSRDLALDSDLACAGLDSLQAIHIASLLRKEGYRLSAVDILTASTLQDLINICRDCKNAEDIRSSSANTGNIPIETISPRLESFRSEMDSIIRCTPLQEAMLAETTIKPSAYCNWIEVELLQACTYEQIRDAILILAQSNEILRTGFYSTVDHGATFVQIIWKALIPSQIRAVGSFSKQYSLGSNEPLLRPLSVQVIPGSCTSRVLFQIHHALYDGWSFDLILRDFGRLLRREELEQRPQYRDVVQYFAREQRVQEDEEHKKYWIDLLRNYVPIKFLNYNGKLIESSGVRFLTGRSTVNMESLFGRADQLKINPQVFFQAATAYILSLYAGSADIVLGNVTSGRTLPVTGIEDILGPCIASLPFRLDFQHISRVRDVLYKTQRLNRESLRHCSFPLREIAKATNVEPGSHLFEALFVWQQSVGSGSGGSPTAKIIDGADDLEYSITLEFEPLEDGLTFRFTFDPCIFPKRQVEYLSQQIDETVQLFLRDVDCMVTHIPRGFQDPCRSMVNPNPSPAYVQDSPARSVEKWASTSPEREAIAFAHIVGGLLEVKDTVTYETLNARANQLARLLIEHGAGQNQLIGLLMEKSVDLYISILAILKVGAGYLPLVPDTPIDRISTILRDAQVAICISESSVLNNLQHDLSTNFLDVGSMDSSKYESQNLDIPYNGSHLAYAVFTSGSTGTPKGVLITQDNLTSNLNYLSGIYPFSANSRMLQASSHAFDVSVFEIFFSWYVGMCLCSAGKDDMFRDLDGTINTLQVTHLSLTPTVAAIVEPENVPGVEFLVTAGEALTERVRRKWAGRNLYQGYGPSETTNICTVKACVQSTDLINNIGPPFDNTSAFVLDPSSDIILPRGAVGELCFGGAQVFRGYLNSPELNAAKIIEHPSFGRIYRSGDMGILLPDNSIIFTGRSDDQVKIRGQRVELGEVTSVMLDHERIQDCTTLLVSRPNDVQALVSFWVPNACATEVVEILDAESFKFTILELFSVLSRRLPSYMVPAVLVPISRIPMTVQGKIDKRILQKMLDDMPEDVSIHFAAPNVVDEQPTTSGEWEKEASKVLAQLLGISEDSIKRESSFFSLGIDSVSAIGFCNALRKADLGDFAVSAILKNKTLAHLASAKDDILSNQPVSKAQKLNMDHVFEPEQAAQILSHYKSLGLSATKIRPCTPLQEAMLSSEQSLSSQAYCNMMMFEIKGDVFRLRECWIVMGQRHEILRTSFVSTDDPSYAFAQVILDDYEIVWHDQDSRKYSIMEASELLSNLRQAYKPPVFLALVEENGFTKLIFCCHHVLYDGIAVATLLEEVQDSFKGLELPPATTFDIYLQHMLSQDSAKADEFWSESFQDFEPTFFPNLSGQATTQHNDSSMARKHLHVPLGEIHQACQDASLSLLSLVQAAWAKMLHFYTGENDICFGNVLSGRSLPGDDLDRLVAPCFNTLPVRVNFDFGGKNSSLLDAVHTFSVKSIDFQLTPLRRIQGLALKEHGRLFDTLVILQQPSKPLDDSIWTLEKDVGTMDLAVMCEVAQDPKSDALELILHYQKSILTDADADVVADTFDVCFSSMIKYPEVAANDTIGFPVNLRAEKNMDFRPFDSSLPFLHSGLERNASLQPDHVALDFLHAGGERTIWTFKTLNEKANDIAHTLIDHDVRPETIVPIHMHKSPEFYATVLGILKAGGAFTPLHPDLPEARKRFMLEELDATKVLCSADSALEVENITLIVVDADIIKHPNCDNPIIEDLRDSHLAYCLFTSGSTGVPKAVSMEHRSPIQTIESSRSLVPWDASSKLLQYAAVTFDMCYYDCFLAWTFGFTLCASEQSEMLNELPSVISTLDVDLLDLTPSVAKSLKQSQVPSVKWLYCIGEAMSSDIVQEWDGKCANSYGPTEAAFCTTIYPAVKDMKTSVIGAPFPTTAFAVFSSQGERPLPLLSTGELYIGGAQLARGYFRKPDLTNERFVRRCGQRFYKSGDIVRMLRDGNFEFIGRADDQVKIRGLRVELGEINHVLQDSHPGIATAVTQILKKDSTAREQLVAFIVLNEKPGDDERAKLEETLKMAATSRLPTYMVPQFFIFIEIVPRSMAGKVYKKALTTVFREWSESQDRSTGSASEASEHNWTELETQIRSIFARLSKTSADAILPTTSIYQLGLDSISAVQIAAALRRQNHHIVAVDVMKHTTCTGIAEFLDKLPTPASPNTTRFDFDAFQSKHQAAVVKACGLEDLWIEAIRPCTPAQRGMLSQFLAKDGSVYMNYLRLTVPSNIDLEKLRLAWATVMERHAILRTGFTHVKDAFSAFIMVQYTPKAVKLPWSVTSDEGSLQPVDEWLQNLQRVAVDKLYLPPWELRLVKSNTDIHLDVGIFHGLFDAQSLQSIFDDVVAAYDGLTLPKTISPDVVVDGILRSNNESSETGQKFWTELGKRANPCRFPNLTSLRCESAPPAVLTHSSAMPLSDIENGCRKANITIQAVGIASWMSILSAYTGENSVACGVVLSGRNFEEAERAVYPCINTVPFVCTVSQDRNELLDTVMALNSDIQQYQHMGLNDIQRLMGFSSEALFDSIFAYQKWQNHDEKRTLWSVADERSTTEYPISIELEPMKDRLEYRLTFLPRIIPKEQAGLILAQFDHIIKSFIFPELDSQDDTKFDMELYAISPAKEPHLPSEASLLHELFEISVKEYPDRIAFEFAHAINGSKYDSKRWTYVELEAEGNRIAHLLISQGVLPGELIAVCFNKCPEASFAILGILKAGCAFVAIDHGAPVARQAFIIKDSQARAVLSMTALSAQFQNDVEVPILNLEDTDTHSLSTSKPVLDRQISTQDRSYCLYTSGTTGTPKGCELTHENAVQALLAFQRLFAGHWDAHSRWLQFASFHFDVSVLEQYWSWSVGICVVSAPRDLIFEDIARTINVLDITHIDLTPSLAQILHPDEVPSLCRGVFITGGESLKQEILDVWGPKHVIYNGYGPTEATIGVTMYPRVPENGKPSNIGQQFDNVGSFVLEPGSNTPVLRGGVGELCVSGKLVGKGYLNRPDLTKERFPYIERFNERVYRTGDLVRLLHDGSFDFLGRADDQVKLRGQRLEVGEINSVIKQYVKTISDVATLVLKHPQQQKEQLVAFIVSGRNANHEPEVNFSDTTSTMTAKDGCHEKLPPYMIPTHFIPLTSMPLNANNKADGGKLRKLYETLSISELQKLSATSGSYAESWSELETRLQEVLADTLNVEKESIGKATSFLELGMDSISVIGVSTALKQAGFAHATASAIIRYSSIHRLAKYLTSEGSAVNDHGSILAAQQAITAIQHRHRHAIAQSLSIDPSEIETLAPCTPLQQGIIAKFLESENGLYFNSFHFSLSSEIDEKRLRAAWEHVYASTQILRTAFIDTQDGYIQVVLCSKSLRWAMDTTKQESMRKDSLDPLQRKRRRVNQMELRQPFKILSVQTPKQKILVVHIFHGLYDGYSIALIFKAVWDAYNGREQHKDTPSFHSALAYGPLRVIYGAKGFWQDHLSNAPLTLIPSLVNEPGHKAVTIERRLEGLTGFDQTRRKLNVTAQAIAQACWLSTLQLYAKVPLTTGVVVSGRSIDFEGANDIIGPMFNTIPYKHDPRRHETWASAIKRVHDFNTAAHPYQHTPLRDIMKWCKRSPNQPLFDTLFVFKITEDDEEWSKNDAWEILDRGAITDYALAFEVEQKADNSFALTLVTQGHISNQQTSSDLLGSFEKALRQVLEDPSEVLDMSAVTSDSMENQSAEDEHGMDKSDESVDFQWTDDATILREDIANLCGVEKSKILETTSIFELGLDSIDAIKLSSKLMSRGVNLPVSGIMRSLTISKMVQNIVTGAVEEDQSSVDADLTLYKSKLQNYLQKCDFDMSDIQDVLPLTPLQEAMVAEMTLSNYSRYYNHDVLKLDPATDVAKLRSAWTRVVESSPILRTSFIEIDDPGVEDSFAQVIHNQPHNFWSSGKVDSKPDFAEVFQELRNNAIKSKLSCPLFSIRHIELPEQSYLILSIAHALYDGWSLSLLHSDVHDAYADHFTPRASYEASLGSILSASGSSAASFWKDFLSGAKPSTFARQTQNSNDVRGFIHRRQRSSKAAVADVKTFTRHHRVSMQSLGQAIFAMVLASHTKSLDVMFGSVLSGRDDDQRSQVLFPTMNTVAIRAILHGTRTEMVQYVQESFQSIKEWQHFPLRKALNLAGIAGRSFESLFIYQKSAIGQKDTSDELWASVQGQSDVEYPVCVEMEIVGDELVWRCAVKEEVFDQTGAEELLNQLDCVLKQVLDHPEHPVIEFTSNGTSVCTLPPFTENTDISRTAADVALESENNPNRDLQSSTAQEIRRVLAAVSKVPEDEITDDVTIFHIGLDSISAIKVSSLLRKQNIYISVGEMLKAGKVESMAAIADARAAPNTANDNDCALAAEEALQGLDRASILQKAGIDESNVSEVLPVTAGQLYMLSTWINSAGCNFYPEFTYELHGSIPFEGVQTSWQALVKANAILRTIFVSTRDDHIPYVQVILREVEVSVENITESTKEEARERIQSTISKQPWAYLFVSETPTGWNLRLRIHHALYDGVSLPLLMRQFQDNCHEKATPAPKNVLGQLVTSSCTPVAFESRESFWKMYLEGTKQQFQESGSDSYSKTELFRPRLFQSTSLEATGRQHGISMHALVLAAYARLFGKLSKSPRDQDVIIGVYLANRSLPIPGIETAAIPTVNLLPLRVVSPHERSVLDTATQVQQDLQDISDASHASASLFEIHEWTGVKVDTFVNFLTLPDTDDAEEQGGEAEHVVINPTKQWQHPVSRVSKDAGIVAEVPRALINDRVNSVYLQAIDIEATICNGAFDVGVFAPTSLLSLEQGEKLVEDLKNELMAFQSD